MLQIDGGYELEGEVLVSGSKNATLPILAGALLLRGKMRLRGVPKIGDVMTFLDILGSIGVSYEFIQNKKGENILHLDTTTLKSGKLDYDKIKKIRSSILLLSPLLHFFGFVTMPFPGGCSIGKRSITSHISGFESIGYKGSFDGEIISLSGVGDTGDRILNAGFGVTSTENLVIANVMRMGQTTIFGAAFEPHVMNLIKFLRKGGARIRIRYNHTIIIEGVKELQADFDFDIIGDYIESGTYMIIAALISKEYLTIRNARVSDLYSFIEKLKEVGTRVDDLGGDVVRVYRLKNFSPVSIQTNIFPGFPTDLQSQFAVLMTQAAGSNQIHEVLFEGRLSFLVELEKMGAHVVFLNPHQALIVGGKKLHGGVTVDSWDLRAGAAMIIAGLIVKGQIKITNVEYIYRGYENLVMKLKSLGAVIKEV